jgi:hypothetical protein
MTTVNGQCRARPLSRVPPQTEEPGTWPEPDWKILFDQVGLDVAALCRRRGATASYRIGRGVGTYPGPDPIRTGGGIPRQAGYFEIVHP